MLPLKYAWVCHKCKETNIPNISACSYCGFPAIARGMDIAPRAESKTLGVVVDNQVGSERKVVASRDKCPACNALIIIPSELSDADVFECSQCKAQLKSYHSPILAIAFVIALIGTGGMYVAFPLFTFAFDRLIFALLALAIVLPLCLLFPIRVIRTTTDK